jgi:peptidoglycan/LPS O-acetylase OafA/YrhL
MSSAAAAAPGPSTTTVSPLGHRPELDGLRAVAVLAVMLLHLPVFGSHRLTGGFLGVDLFFVLSGFLITSLLLEEWRRGGSISLRRFYARRALRLLPALVAVVLACSAYGALWGPRDERKLLWRAGLAALGFATNWLILWDHAQIGKPLSHTWSLSLEEHFYLIWPVLLLWLLSRRVRPRLLAGLIALGVTAVGVYRHLLCLDLGNVYHALACLDARGDGLLAGCLVGVLSSFGMLPRGGRGRALLQAAALASAGFTAYLMVCGAAWILELFRGLFTVVAAAFAVVLAALLSRPPRLVRDALSLPPLAWVGRLSYGLYLWHIPVAAVLSAQRLGCGEYTAARVQFAASFAVAAASYYGLERPFLRLKQRFRSTPVDRGAPALALAPAPTSRAG